MHGQIDGGNSESEVIPFSRAESNLTSEENSRHALETAQKLSHQLRAAEDRIVELETEIAAYQQRAQRAEQWLHRVYTEIEERFLRQDDGRRSMQRTAARRA